MAREKYEQFCAMLGKQPKEFKHKILDPETDEQKEEIEDSQGGTRHISHNILNNIGLRYSRNLRGTKCVTLSDNGTLSTDDRQALQTIISIWQGLSPEDKVKVLQTIEAVMKADLVGSPAKD